MKSFLEILKKIVPVIQDVKGLPYLKYEKWDAQAKELTDINSLISSQQDKFPLVFLLLDVTEQVNITEQTKEVRNAKIFIIDRTEQNKTAKWRDANTFPLLRSLKDKLLHELEKYCFGEFTFNETELYFLGTAEKNQNKLNSIVDAIELNITNYKYYYC